MLFFTRRRANQLTMARKFTGRAAAASAALKCGAGSNSEILAN
jgi:hypothetical protein